MEKRTPITRRMIGRCGIYKEMKFTSESQPDFERELQALFNEAKKVFQLDRSRTQHGPTHWQQVERNVIMLAEKTSGCDLEVARRFAILHDCRRENESADPKHGARAAEFALELFTKGMLRLDSARLVILKFALEHHNGGLVSGDPTIGVCWDADRLDLPRVGTKPYSDLMSTQHGKQCCGG